jgi:hypothetical protein
LGENGSIEPKHGGENLQGARKIVLALTSGTSGANRSGWQ